MSVRLASSAVALALLTACSSAGSLHEVAIETPLQPKLDVSSPDLLPVVLTKSMPTVKLHVCYVVNSEIDQI